MAAKNKDKPSVFSRFAVVVLAVLYRMLTLHQYMSFVFYKMKHGIRYLWERCPEKLLHNIQKRPDHLAIVFSEPEISFGDVAKLICWCHEAGINYVTLYEPRGILKKSDEKLLRSIQKLAPSKFSIKFHSFSSADHQEVDSIDAVREEVHVHLAAAEDGRGAIVEAARKLHQVQTGVTMKSVDNMLKVTCDWPEPDLLIRCGGLNSHLGFLPWALRLTEFADLYSHHRLFPSEFRDILATFSITDRRCGR
ncbi:dehydrodolichyl diphosphate synthase complex subunit nus1 [Galendromus occidentalis]|uniref:ditrans,polycis-polyprenyl diphosphate synthase [(2E,6E)-farnesyldiphosphate specific] n=1 Tax=Galendromus occidentalis TaxID=34638 RepID=A0AAJ6QXU0_9ACAR|nr:dehydrodolichyl diphosphate synthase complex subunit nus1 [Galendromus occidentalis]